MLETIAIEWLSLLGKQPYLADIRLILKRMSTFYEVVLNNSNCSGFLSPHFRTARKQLYCKSFFIKYNCFLQKNNLRNASIAKKEKQTRYFSAVH